jgi:hypothetical protein
MLSLRVRTACVRAQYCRSLRFDDKPDFSYLRKMFRDLFGKEGYQWDYVFDWTILKHQQSRPQAAAATLGETGGAEDGDTHAGAAGTASGRRY